jgi:low affinity Fe/Cu permease
MALLTANDKISRQDVERIVAKVEETKEEVVSKAKKVEDAVQKKIKETKEAALHQAEVARKTAATAAWWLFATAVVSAIASAAGGLVALAG